MQGEIFIPITMFAAIGIVLYQFIKSRHAERMAIIDKGLSEEQLSYLLKSKKAMTNSTWSLKLGAVLVGVGLAVIIGSLVPYDLQEEFTTGLVFMLPGIALLLVYKYADIKTESE